MDWELGIHLEWELSDLIFSRNELSAAREAMRMNSLREKVLMQVTHDYFERRRLQIAGKLGKSENIEAEVTRSIRVEELTANLDAMTGGRFSTRLQVRG